MTTAPELVPVDPTMTRLKLLDFIRRLQAKALEFPDGSTDRVFLQGQALGVYLAVCEMTGDIAAALKAAASGEPTLNN